MQRGKHFSFVTFDSTFGRLSATLAVWAKREQFVFAFAFTTATSESETQKHS
jgi:hypothetical protein